MKIIAVIPCYNEQDFVGDVVRACKRHVNDVIVSDDASTDDTIHAATTAGGHVIKVSSAGTGRGAGACTKRGIDKALDEGADIIVTLDGDGQHDPNDIPTLMAPIAENKADMVIGSRFLVNGYKIKRYRKLGIDAITRVLNFGASTKVVDGQSCFRAFSRRVLEQIEITENRFSFSVEVPIKARAAGFRITEVPVRCIYHDNHNSNSTINPIRHGIPVLLNTAKWRLWELRHKSTKQEEDNRTKVMIFSGFYLPHAGGAIYDTHVLARGLVSKGYNIEVITCNTEHSPRTETIGGVRVIRLSCWNLLKGQFPIPKPSVTLCKLFTGKVNLVSTQTRFFATSFLGLLVAKWHGVPLVHTERGSMHSVVQSGLVDRISQTYDHTIGSLIVKSSDVCVGLSAEVCTFLEHLGGTIPVRIPLGVHPAFTDKTRYGTLTGGKTLVYVGRLIYAKGVHDLLDAFGWVKIQVPNASLTIVGDGNYRTELEGIAGPEVTFLGELPQERVADVLATADIFIHPSYSEGQPSAVAEASAIGLPVIATDVGGTRELVEDGVTGYLVSPKDIQALTDKILDLLTNTDKAKRMGRAGREKMLKEYPWSAMVDSYDKLLKGVIVRWIRG